MKFERYTPVETVLESMVEVTFPEGPDDGFRKVKETLQRMGVPARTEKTLYQTAHILHKKGRYYICHFKMMFAIDGKEADVSESDIARMNLIVKYLKDWGMVTPVKEEELNPIGSPRMLKVIKYPDRDDWNLEQKYNIGGKRDESAQ